MLVFADLLEVRAHNLLRHQTERIVVGARTDGADHLVWFGGGEDEHHMLRRLLHDFQQRVEALRRDHVGFVENENLVAVAGGGESGTFAQFAGIVHTVVRSGVDFHHVDGTGAACGEVLAAFAFAARVRGRAFRAVDATRENACGTGFAAAARTGKQVSVRKFVLIKRSHQRNRDLILPDHAVERVGTIPSIECQCHRNSFRCGVTRLPINYDTFFLKDRPHSLPVTVKRVSPKTSAAATFKLGVTTSTLRN